MGAYSAYCSTYLTTRSVLYGEYVCQILRRSVITAKKCMFLHVYKWEKNDVFPTHPPQLSPPSVFLSAPDFIKTVIVYSNTY